jgi:glycerol-3-phosphate dehydrogenase
VQAVRYGATVCNYAAVRSLDSSESGCRALVEDTIDGSIMEVAARRVIVAGGVWNDRIEAMTNQVAPPRLRPSKGIHLVLRRKDVPLDTAACFISDAKSERMLFLIPWNNVVVAGTTDVDYSGLLDHPRVTSDERSYFLDALNAALGLSLSEHDVVSAWAGLRPLVRAERGSTVDLSRNDAVYDFAPGIVGITGGKLTTYRRMAQEAVDHVAPHFDKVGRSRTRCIKLGCHDVGALTECCGSSREAAWYREGVHRAACSMLRRQSSRGARRRRGPLLRTLRVAAESGLTEPLGPGGHLGFFASELSWSTAETERQEIAFRADIEAERGTPLPREIGAYGARA